MASMLRNVVLNSIKNSITRIKLLSKLIFRNKQQNENKVEK